MPLIYYQCEHNHFVSKFYRQAKEAPVSLSCTACSGLAKKQLKAPSSTSRIVVDNGFQARSVEINPNIIEINEERSNKNYSEE